MGMLNSYFRFPPPGPVYCPHASARFVKYYRSVAAGLHDAMQLSRRYVTLWLCPNCEHVNKQGKADDRAKQCNNCERTFTYNEILLGQVKQ